MTLAPLRTGRIRVHGARVLQRVATALLLAPLFFAAAHWIGLVSSGAFLATLVLATLGAFGLHIASHVVLRQDSKGSGPSTVDVDAQKLVMRGASNLDCARADVRAGTVTPGSSGVYRSELELANGDIVFADFLRADRAEAMLDSIGVGPARRRTRVAMRSKAEGATISLALLLTVLYVYVQALPPLISAGASVLIVGAIVLLPALFVLLGLPRLLQGTECVVGSDGVLIDGRFTLRRFIRYDEVAEVRGSMLATTFVMRDGRSIVVGASTNWQAQALLERVQEAMSARDREQRMTDRAHLLERGGQPLQTWKRRLEGVLGAGGYRSGGIDASDAMEIIRRGDVPAERRIGAALALRASKDPEMRERVRIAAELCANPQMRVALESIAAEQAEDEAIEEALKSEERATS